MKYGIWNLDKATRDGVDKMAVVHLKKNMKMMKKYAGKKKIGKKLSAAYRAEARNDDAVAQTIATVFPVVVETEDD